MTISSTTRTAGPFVGTGAASIFPFQFKVFLTTDILVVTVLIATGAQTVLELGPGYTVALNANQDSYPGGTVTLTAGPLAAGIRMTITSDVQDLQPTEYLNQGGFYPEVLTASLDRVTILIQQLQTSLSLALMFPLTDPMLQNTLPPAEERAGLVLGFDAYGNATAVAASGGGGGAITVAIGTVTTLAPGSPATVTNTGAGDEVILNFGLPAGAPASAPTAAPQTATGAVDGVNVGYIFAAPTGGTAPVPLPTVYAGGVFQMPGLDYESPPTQSGTNTWTVTFYNPPAEGPIVVVLLT